jgi:hypothetical protein
VSAETTHTSVTPGKSCPLATIWVPTSTSISPAAKARQELGEPLGRWWRRPGRGGRRARTGIARRPRPRCARCRRPPAPADRPQAGHRSGTGLVLAAVVTLKVPPPEVEGERDVTAAAGHPLTARLANHRRRVPAPVEEQDGLLSAAERLPPALHHRRGERRWLLRRPRRSRSDPAEVHQLDAWHRPVVHPRRQAETAVAPAARVLHRLQRGCRRAEHHRGPGLLGADHRQVPGLVAELLVLLERGIVLLVHHEERQVSHRREHRRAHAHRQSGPCPRGGPSSGGAAPGLASRCGAPATRAPEAAPEAAHQLRGEGDLRDQHQRSPTPGERVLRGLEVHLGLPAAGDALEAGRAGSRRRRARAAARPAPRPAPR